MKPTRITIHCSATPNGKPFTAADIREWHTKRGFVGPDGIPGTADDIGYHAVFCVDGIFQQGRPDLEKGAHVEGHNTGNLGCVFIGTDKFSMAQFNTFKWWLFWKMREYGIPADKIFCHYEYDTAQAQGKTCPNMELSRLKAFAIDGVSEAIEPYLI